MAFYTEDIFGDAVVSEVNEEFNLPEYEPEIKKILRVTARILPAGKYIGAGKAEFAGNVIYGVIYLGSEGEIGTVNLSSDYEFAVPFPDTDAECAVYASVRADNVLCRPTGPRRLSFRTRLKSRIEMLKKTPVPIVSAPKNAEMLRDTQRASLVERVSSGEFEISGDIKLSAKPVVCDASVCNTDVRKEGGALVCRGELWVRVTCSDGALSCAEKRIPFERRVEFDAQDGDTYRVIPACLSCECSGEGESAFVSAIAEMDVECARSFDFHTVRDAFIPGLESVLERGRTDISAVLVNKNATLSVSGSKKLTAEEAEASEAICPFGEISFEKPVADGERIIANGTLTLHTILTNGADYYPQRLEIPFKFTPESAQGTDGTMLISNVSGTLASVKLKIENGTLTADGEINICASVYGKKQVQSVCAVKGEKSAKSENGYGVKIVYPQKADTLWSVAKERAVPVLTLAEENGVDIKYVSDSENEQSLKDTRVLVFKK